MAAYKDENYRAEIADRYGIFLTCNEKGFNEPHLKKIIGSSEKKKPLFEQYKEKYGNIH